MSITERPLRVAIVGSGPSGFYAAGSLLAHEDRPVEVDMLERLPTPWGLVRSGVAPDHPKIKSVTRVYEKTAEHPRFRWYGNVDVGRDVSRAELLERYDAIVYAVGAESGRPLDVPGADLPGVAPATHFVGWYNGHPDHRDHDFDLSVEHAVVIGNGNVAVDVARMLSLSHDELRTTDIADHALDAMRESRISSVTLLGRRGPVQAAFTTPELRELGELERADVVVDSTDLALDDHSLAALEDEASPTTKRNIAVLQGFAARARDAHRPRTIALRFLRSPVEIVGDGRVEGVVVAVNELVLREDGTLAARPTGATETLPAGLVLSSIGYRGRPVTGTAVRRRSRPDPQSRGPRRRPRARVRHGLDQARSERDHRHEQEVRAGDHPGPAGRPRRPARRAPIGAGHGRLAARASATARDGRALGCDRRP